MDLFPELQKTTLSGFIANNHNTKLIIFAICVHGTAVDPVRTLDPDGGAGTLQM